MKEPKQQNLFEELGVEENWRDDWKGMPEFENVDNAPFQQVTISFQTEEDRKEFEKLINQKMTYKTKSIWFPKKNEIPPKNFLYINKNKEDEKEQM